MPGHWVEIATGRYVGAGDAAPSWPEAQAEVDSAPPGLGYVWRGGWVAAEPPASVPRAAWLIALSRSGLLAGANAAAEAAGGETLIKWQAAARFYRAGLLPQLGAVGVSEAQLDAVLHLADAIDRGLA